MAQIVPDPTGEFDLEVAREVGSPRPTIDARARSEYRGRLRGLGAELDGAERVNDLGRSERLGSVIEMVGQQLTGSGLRGRARTASGRAERARVGRQKTSARWWKRFDGSIPGWGVISPPRSIPVTFRAYQPDPDNSTSWQF